MVNVNAFVIRVGKTKHGRGRKFAKLEFAQAAIAAIYPKGLRADFNQSELTRKVNKHLQRNRDYRKKYKDKKVGRMTVLRALDRLREANQPWWPDSHLSN
jgi:hypothetical protein